LVSIKTLSSNILLIYNGWKHKKDTLVVIGFFILITMGGIIYAYATQGWIQNFFWIWVLILGLVLIYVFSSGEEIRFIFEKNQWIITKRALFIPIMRFSGKISNISALITKETIDTQSFWSRLFSPDHISYLATLILKTFGKEKMSYNYYPIISKRAISSSSQKNILMQYAIIGKAVIDIFSQYALPLDYEIQNESDQEDITDDQNFESMDN